MIYYHHFVITDFLVYFVRLSAALVAVHSSLYCKHVHSKFRPNWPFSGVQVDLTKWSYKATATAAVSSLE
jgi:hypothetical protein